MRAETKDIKELYRLVLKNRKKGIEIRQTLREQKYSTGNFYRRISKKQAEKLSNLKGLSNAQKKEFKELYLNKGWTADRLRVRYGCRTKTAIDFAKECTDDYTRSLKNHNRKLTKYQVIKILISSMRDGIMQKDLADKYKVSACNISSICAGRHWKHIFQGVKEKYNKEILGIVDKNLLKI